MKTLEQIKDDYAIDLGYLNWESLMTEVCYFSNEEFFEHENEVMILVQKECLESARERVIWMNNKELEEEITNQSNILK